MNQEYQQMILGQNFFGCPVVGLGYEVHDNQPTGENVQTEKEAIQNFGQVSPEELQLVIFRLQLVLFNHFITSSLNHRIIGQQQVVPILQSVRNFRLPAVVNSDVTLSCRRFSARDITRLQPKQLSRYQNLLQFSAHWFFGPVVVNVSH